MTSERRYVYSPKAPPGNKILEVEGGETVTVDISMATGISAIEQPDCVAFVDSNHSGPSVYSVVDSAGMPVAPAIWTASGGAITAAVDRTTLRLEITGGTGIPRSPFLIAMAAGPGRHNAYPSLWISTSEVAA